jgi:hypothetical protein
MSSLLHEQKQHPTTMRMALRDDVSRQKRGS